MILWLSLACAPDDVSDRPDVDDTADSVTDSGRDDTGSDTDTGADTQSLVGRWVSAGEDICDLLAGDPFNYARIEAEFGSNGQYTVVATDDGGQTGTLSGSFTTSTATVPGTVTLNQTAPYTATALGIWQVAGNTLTYEVVQTDPDYGFTPPTPEAGFGSTAGDGIDAGANVQVYRAN